VARDISNDTAGEQCPSKCDEGKNDRDGSYVRSNGGEHFPYTALISILRHGSSLPRGWPSV
jgi:hypothetical protein